MVVSCLCGSFALSAPLLLAFGIAWIAASTPPVGIIVPLAAFLLCFLGWWLVACGCCRQKSDDAGTTNHPMEPGPNTYGKPSWPGAPVGNRFSEANAVPMGRVVITPLHLDGEYLVSLPGGDGNFQMLGTRGGFAESDPQAVWTIRSIGDYFVITSGNGPSEYLVAQHQFDELGRRLVGVRTNGPEPERVQTAQWKIQALDDGNYFSITSKQFDGEFMKALQPTTSYPCHREVCMVKGGFPVTDPMGRWQIKALPCEADGFRIMSGYFPRGRDVEGGSGAMMSLAEAKARCRSLDECVGFCHQGLPGDPGMSEMSIWLKHGYRVADILPSTAGNAWTSYVKLVGNGNSNDEEAQLRAAIAASMADAGGNGGGEDPMPDVPATPPVANQACMRGTFRSENNQTLDFVHIGNDEEECSVERHAGHGEGSLNKQHQQHQQHTWP